MAAARLPSPPTQVRRPWRATARTAFQALVALAVSAPLIYQAATGQDPGQATGAAAAGLAVCAAVARVMALPAVEGFLRRFVPFLAAEPAPPGLVGDAARAAYETQRALGHNTRTLANPSAGTAGDGDQVGRG